MDIIENKNGDVVVLKLIGRLDTNTSQSLSDKAIGLIDGGLNKLVLDLAELNYISSAGLRVLLMLAKKLKSIGGKVALASLQDNVKEVFELSGFSSIFESFPGVSEATASFK